MEWLCIGKLTRLESERTSKGVLRVRLPPTPRRRQQRQREADPGALDWTDNAHLRSQLEHRVKASSPETRPPSTTELHAGSAHQDSLEYGGVPHFSFGRIGTLASPLASKAIAVGNGC